MLIVMAMVPCYLMHILCVALGHATQETVSVVPYVQQEKMDLILTAGDSLQ
jgi:hypothetical protein